MKISIFGMGYVGLSNAILLAQNNEVSAIDIDLKKIHLINNKKSPIKDKEIEDYFKNKKLNLHASKFSISAIEGSKFIIIATPTNYDPERNYFDTSSVEEIIKAISNLDFNPSIVIRSTIPIGFVKKMRMKFQKENIFYCPEFLREGKALYDNLYPSRIIIGSKSMESKEFSKVLKNSCIKDNIKIIHTGKDEAEAIKLFSNSYLAMRVAFFNELDSFSFLKDLNTVDIINGVGLDPRIGDFYNNPSFGYGGYCLPKDTKQLRSNFDGIPQNIISAIVESNDTRIKFIADSIIKKKPRVVGIYKLAMKSNSDNFRDSSILKVAESIIKHSINLIIFEPQIDESEFDGIEIVKNLQEFKTRSDIILTNRVDHDLQDAIEKVFTRDIYSTDD
tara:strand:- start:2521 stop:3690 length:1170 start_codon:yes stop_codon:yes gene_type:complete